MAGTIYVKNNDQQTIKPGWQGNRLKNGRFVNLDMEYEPSMLKVLKWKWSKNPQQQEKENDKWSPPVDRSAEFLQLNRNENFMVWLGHSSVYICLGGKILITDPVFFDLPFIKRLAQLPVSAYALKPDYILLSHDHRDHCDEKSLKMLVKENANTQVLTGLNMKKMLSRWMPENIIHEAGWYQRYNLADELEITFMPAQHWSRRGVFDTNKRLWGSFVIKHKNTAVYFAADSGYAAHFLEIGELFPNLNWCLMPVGAYKPAFMMQEVHVNPAEAALAFADTGAAKMLPIHYGTYDLADEPVSEPYRLIKELVPQNALVTSAVGEIVWL